MASTRLTRTFSAGNRKKWTMSMWVKRSALGVDQKLMGKFTSQPDRFALLFNSSNQLQIFYGDGGSNKQITTNRLFRDTSAFYNFTFIIDTGNSTESDRMQIWVNGIRETSMASTTYPTINQDLPWNDAGLHEIGSYTNGNNFDGIMSYVHFSDGYSYDASYWGSTDSTTGEWKINASPSFTLGTNGFTILKDGNTVTDQSTNSNNWTVESGTLTKTKDCPDNVFATLNPLARFQVAPTYSNGNNTITAGVGGSGSSPFSTIGASSGKYYAEFLLGSANGGGISCGIIDITQFNPNFQTDAWFYYPTYGYAYMSSNGKKGNNNAEANYANSYTNGDRIGVAMDLDNNKLYFAKNGVWQNSGDPTSGATGTGAAFTIADGTYGFAVYGYDSKVWNANFGNGYFGTTAITTNSGNGYAGAEGASKFSYQPPTGYSALNTKGLNQ